MHVLVPPWITHTDKRQQKTPIYSIDIHPKGDRLATGGQDSKVKIWNFAPIISKELENDPNTIRLIATLSSHSGAVLCVRWSNITGEYLATGSDDWKIIIWKQQHLNLQSEQSFSNTKTAVKQEVWKSHKVLSGHTSDVSDLAWSPDNRYLASCGFDTLVFIWDTKTFEKLRKLEAHTGFVKGVTWDPVGKYLATQSDDKTTKIWRVSDWSVEKTISEPYEVAASNTFFRKLSWSPDGSCLVTSNSENGNLPVCAIISRNKWAADISLVGYEAPVECTAFNPVLFRSNDIENGHNKDSDNNVSALCATGGQDNSVIIWSTMRSRAILGAKQVFHHSVLGLSWSPDGRCLLACSFDGTTVAFVFSEGELGTPVPREEIDKRLEKYGYKKNAPLVEIPEQLSLMKRLVEMEEDTDLYGSTNKIARTENFKTPFKPTVTSSAQLESRPLSIQNLVDHSSGKKSSSTQKQEIFYPNVRKKHNLNNVLKSGSYQGSKAAQDTKNPESNKTNISNIMGEYTAPRKSAIPTTVWQKVTDQDSSVQEQSEDTALKYILPVVFNATTPITIGIPKPRNTLMVQVPAANGGISLYKYVKSVPRGVISCTIFGKKIWTDYLHEKPLHLVASSDIVALSTLNAKVLVYTPNGRRMLPYIALDSVASFLCCNGSYLMCVSCMGTVSVWDMKNMKTTISFTPILRILNPNIRNDSFESSNDTQEQITTVATIENAFLLSGGVPVFSTTLGELYTFHGGIKSWMKIADKMRPIYSPVCANPDNFDTSLLDYSNLMSNSLGDIENQLVCLILLNKKGDFESRLRYYARRLADENAVSRICELCDDLIGRVVEGSLCATSPTDTSPDIMGVPKRSLLKMIIPILTGHNSNLQKTLQPYIDALKGFP